MESSREKGQGNRGRDNRGRGGNKLGTLNPASHQ